MEMDIGLILAAVSLLGLGLYPVFLKKAIDLLGEYTCMLFAQLVLAIAAIITAVFTIRLSMPSDLVIIVLLFAALINAFTLYIYYKAINSGQVSLVVAIASIGGIITVALSYLLFGEAVYPINFLGLLLIIIGVFLAAMDHPKLPKKFDEHALFEFFSSKVWNPSAGLALLAAVATAFVALLMKYAASGIGPHKSMIYMHTATLLFISLAFLAKPAKELVSWPKRPELKWLIPAALLLAAGIIGTYFAISSAKPSTVSTITSAAPLITLIAAVIIIKERFRFRQYLGLLMIIGGIVCLTL
jgi:drug/metabolite transporter (DMT)-like permease